ncbi:MAG: diacylglycerol kinase family protein, partial [Actinomycetaceae bacterium]|nr:diacylglycerol kinase family protein [Actinomycetaceae bacterium]
MNPGTFIALGAVAVAGIGGFALFQRTKRRQDRRAAHQEALLAPHTPIHPDKGIPRPWVIVNPSKFDDLNSFKATVEAAAAEHGVTHVHWRETSVEDPGTGQAAQAVADGASVVLAAGGDGTVRAVAAGLAGTGVRMGVLPSGTGNLFARNLHLPVDDVAKAVHVALGKGHRAIDLCWMRVDDIEEPAPSTPEG